MAQIPTPPASPHVENSRRAPANNSLLEPLESPNALLERYLHLLDQHQKLQEELGKQLSSVCRSRRQAPNVLLESIHTSLASLLSEPG